MAETRWVELDQLNVLAVDDNSINREFLRAALGSRVAVLRLCGSGHEAIRLCREERFDLVLMDLHMPDMDGLGAWQSIVAEAGDGPAPRVIALTADSRPEERDRLRAAGFNGFLGKPVGMELLLGTMLRVANGQSGFVHLQQSPSGSTAFLDDARALDANGSISRVRAMRKALAEEVSRGMPELDQNLAAAQYDDAAELLHQWVGACGYAGTARLERACRALEQCLNERLDSSPGTLYLELRRTAAATVQAIALDLRPSTLPAAG